MREQTKLRALLLGLWLLLLVPTLFLGYQTYQRLQFESLHQYRTLAETLTDGIAGALRQAMEQESARDPAEYRFRVGANPSPLSLLDPISGLPGILGFFQVDANGELSSPVMPLGEDLANFAVEEVAVRQLRLRNIENALVLDLPQAESVVEDTSGRQDALADADVTSDAFSELLPQSSQARVNDSRIDSLASPSANVQRNQVLYEELSQVDKPQSKARERTQTSAARKLELETDYFSRSLEAEVQELAVKKRSAAKRSKSKTLSAPEAKVRLERAVSEPSISAYGVGAAAGAARSPAVLADAADAKIETSLFGSTVSDFALRPLSANHLVLFRRVWQSEQPLIQGLVLERQAFFAGAITQAYGNSALAEVSDLAVAVDGQVQLTLAAGSEDYTSGARLSGGELLYRRYLGAPFGNVELLYSARELPLASGAGLVLWTLVVLVALLCAGFMLLYILGKRQLAQRQQQQDFVSAVSHELKTPLTSIRMYGEMLQSGWVEEAKKPEYYDYIFNESERLSRLISNVLQLSSITRGRNELQLAPLTVAQILDLLRSRSTAQVKAQGYELIIACDAQVETTSLVVDEDALLQVMINLIDNGLKFSDGCERRELLLDVTREANSVVFSLRDYGPGIDPGQLGKIFELFYRTESELTRETVGTGIGLALVQELVSAMGGKITARNAEPGAVFEVRLPCSLGGKASA